MGDSFDLIEGLSRIESAAKICFDNGHTKPADKIRRIESFIEKLHTYLTPHYFVFHNDVRKSLIVLRGYKEQLRVKDALENIC